MSTESSLNAEMSKTISLFGLKGVKLWVLICLVVGTFIVLALCVLSLWIMFRRKSRRPADKFPLNPIPHVSKDIRVDRVGFQNQNSHPESLRLPVNEKSSDRNSEKMLSYLGRSKSSDNDSLSQCSSAHHHERACSFQSGEEGSFGTATARKQRSLSYGGLVTESPLVGLPEISHLGWGHWFTLRDLELATNRFSTENVIGEGGYGVVYRGRLINGAEVAVKKLLNNMGQAEREFRVEVEAIGHVRHKNLVRLLGYCIEGVHRMLVYEYVNNGNLEQWLHGAMHQHGTLTWEARMKIILGTAQALAYLHEAIEPKVVHRDIKASNILIDDGFNAKISDFGLAKLLDSGESHITTRVMGTFGYVAPEYANTGLLNEKSDIYSFGVLLLEAVTGRDPVDYGRPANEVNMVEWLKMMVGTRRAEEVVDQSIEAKPTTRALKRALLVALRCVDPEAEKRPKMSQVVRMLETDEHPFHEDRRRRSRTASMEIVETEEESTGTSRRPAHSDSHTSNPEKDPK
ncbi:PREDICTED: probable receptor-like protein kinase At2g42960 isoform X1 [Tarenaya hassleriana]|uniref:probable receptor-like protein kinase At2g42960 isoform X1 n=1 Tax=Tarenaya hassleriana TaxID=28532 RepID=UPI00053C94A0|nr:PREDICTED: probable receptor-like protein kinase At2g42960 isoform X1 [Tarenaya hassleriana]XP_010524103.1 PREDICTED: probable receptor-like protein kinase At2g42960 isoform X1 [Tarenaya hassleriana]XP_019056801.1 PREDICTED: probable receptor-like protein kinase At2g42960 isoform X1 [Tarenaya hassleriana]XP_019056803.1 PREDICTED: probable receptor-like protein kinase At2g42960 isoform X1 [Tarenaya hassleriana]XP_019056804.1 PREDICTED: probable receptor-like protein kinase At2g42960 isoform X